MPTEPSHVSLPNHATLDGMRHEAKRLQKAIRSEIPQAIELATSVLGDIGPAIEFPLHTAQLAVARAHGFASWPKLKHYFDLADDLRFDGRTPIRADAEAPADRFCRLGCLTYNEDDPARMDRARAMLAATPGLAQADIWAATVAGDIDAVRGFLATDPTLIRRRGGPHRWTPLYYLAYSRVRSEDPVPLARLLLDAGADPDEGYLWGGQPLPFTVLTGIFGEGELGAVRQPRAVAETSFARLLLDAGAEPNDGQTLYNRQFRPDDSHLTLLFEYGLGQGDGGPWRRRLGELIAAPAVLLRQQLSWAIDHGFVDRVRLLLAHRVDPGPLPDGRLPIPAARAAGHPAITGLLRDAGADEPRSTPTDRVIDAVMVADRVALAAVRTEDPDAVALARRRRPGLIVWAAANGRIDVVGLLLELGWDVNARGRGDAPVESSWETALHQAAGNGDDAMVAVLLANGADRTARDDRFSSTPGDWAGHFGHHELAAELA